jgi:hypothetical protein
MSGARLWHCWQRGIRQGSASTRQAAMNIVDRPFRSGNAMVRHERTGETWERRFGSWSRLQLTWPKKEKAS